MKNYFDLYINSLTFKSLWHFGSTCQNPPLFCSLDYHLYSKKDKYQQIDDKFNQRKKKIDEYFELKVKLRKSKVKHLYNYLFIYVFFLLQNNFPSYVFPLLI